jgi:ribosome-associated heat shock protein Hsp15
MTSSANTRIDKFLWAVRIFKTRSAAAEECKKGRILINNQVVKPSYPVIKGAILTVKKLPTVYTYEVLAPVENRISAKLVPEYILDLTPAVERDKSLISRTSGFGYRPRGLGRPTKKDRRSIEKFSDGFPD